MTEEITHLQTKLQHVDIHNHWLWQEVNWGQVIIEYMPTKEMIANRLTKALPQGEFKTTLEQLGLEDLEDEIKVQRTAKLHQEEILIDELTGVAEPH